MLNDEALFKKLKSNIAARSKLSSIHAARAYKYGHVQFGPKSWYKESVIVFYKWTSQEDRRKFRQGLTCNVEFLNQLNIHDLVKDLMDGKMDITSLSKSIRVKLGDIFECLKEIPMIGILKFIDNEKAQKNFSTIDRNAALAYVSQSMWNYFARDDSLNPALSVVCEALRGWYRFWAFVEIQGGHLSILSFRLLSFKITGGSRLKRGYTIF